MTKARRLATPLSMTKLAEFELAAACCRWPPGPEKSAAVKHAAAGIDWPRFEKVVQRHRIEPLVLSAFEEVDLSVPTETMARLRTEAVRVRRDNLLIAGECERLRRHLVKGKIDHLFVKGLALAKLAYGGISLKKGWDIDLLVAPGDLDRSGGLLAELGYRRTLPACDSSPEALAAWRAQSKEEIWTHQLSGVPLELHWSLVDNPRLLPGVGTDSDRQRVEIARGVSLPTLADAPLYAYLSVHGASSAWFRLKWIADFNAFLSGRSEVEIEDFHRRAVALGAGRTSAAALLLIEQLFGRNLPDGLAKLRRNRPARLLARLSLIAMTRKGAVAEPTESKAGALVIHIVQALAMPGITFFGSEVRRQAFNPMNALELHVPPGARFLYPFLLIPLWVRRRAAIRTQRASAIRRTRPKARS